MGFDHQLARECLQSLQLGDLFVQALGWAPPTGKLVIATRAFNQPYRCHGIAQRGDVTVWEIKLKRTGVLTPKLKARLYQTLQKQSAQPLIIFVDRQLSRSLWYWEQSWGAQSVPQSVVYIPQQPDGFWEPRLHKLWAYQPEAGTLTLRPDWPPVKVCAELAESFAQQVQQLSESISGISAESDRQTYAALILKRLIVIHLLQQRGLLDDGDIWYLHNRLSQSQQQGSHVFFRQYLQPLFHQGFSLPEIERPRAVRQRLGTLPYLGNLFYGHPLEQQYPELDIQDTPFEAILVWLSEPIWEQSLNAWQSAALGYVLEQQIFTQTIPGYPSHPLLVAQSCDRILETFALQQLGLPVRADTPGLYDLLFQGESSCCRQLIQTVLPQIQILDPACGAGTFLAAALQRLTEIYSSLVGHVTTLQDSQLTLWLSSIQAEHPDPLQSIYRRILKQSLYGVDRLPAAVETTQLQLLLPLITTAHHPQDLEPLPNLDFNILTGNSLVGFIRVDEQGFDRINTQGEDEALQGNLLQPLAAESYRTILAEKNISLEHYRTQTSAFKELQAIPAYAQLAFLRETINQLDQKAQAKLNNLLLSEFSQKLGIHFKEPQLTEKPQRRLLTVADLEPLHPCHWGYCFNALLEQHGGFNLILSAPPWSIFRPTVEEFFQHFRDLAHHQDLDSTPFKTSKQALIKSNPDLAQAWLFYQSQYAFLTDYFYRAEQYAHQTPTVKGRRVRSQLRLDWLFVEQCFNLLSPHGVCSLVLPSDLGHSPKAEPIRTWLAQNTHLELSPALPKPAEKAKLPPFSLLFWVMDP
jgi:hypothetical protein